MRLFALSFIISALIHVVVLVFLPAYINRQEPPLLTTVVVELLEKPAPEADKVPTTPPVPEIKPPEPPKPVQKSKPAQKPNPVKGPKPPKIEPKSQKVTFDDTPREPAEPVDPTSSMVIETTMRMDSRDKRYKGFLDGVRSAVNRQWNSRDAMIAAQRSGTVTIQFTLAADGGMAQKVSILETSQSDSLDDEARRAVRAAYFPAFPSHWKLERLNLVGEFVYTYNTQE